MIERHEFDFRAAAGPFDDQACELEHACLAFVAHIDRLTRRLAVPRKQVESGHGIAHIAEGAGLGAVAEYGEGLPGQRLLDESWQDKSVITALPRANRVEKSRDGHLQTVFLTVGHGLDFVGQLAQGIASEPTLPRQIDQFVVLAQIATVAVTVNRRTRGDDHLRVVSGGSDRLEQTLGGADVDLRDPHRLAQHAEHADHGGKVVDPVGRAHRTVQFRTIRDVGRHKTETRVALEIPDVVPVPRTQVIDGHHFIATVQMMLDDMGTDESCPAGD